jgi:murein DD-endopeptidase MepM/ murein hydrolase activator NlpD
VVGSDTHRGVPRRLLPQLSLRRSALLSLPTAAVIALVPMGASPVDGPLVDVQRPASAVSAANPAPQSQPLPFETLADPRLARQRKPTPPSLLTGYHWPLPRGRLTNPFGPTGWGDYLVDGQSLHDGIDLATFCGDRIVAAHDGVVIAAGRHYDEYIGWKGNLKPYLRRLDRMHLWMTLPNVVVIDDGNMYRSMYAHFSRIVVRRGQVVKAGQLLGYEGATGHATGCHLHYGLFSPFETARFGLDPAVVGRMKLPKAEIARIDPLLVLPERTLPKPKTKPAAETPGAGESGG